MKQSIESVLGADNVVIDVHQLSQRIMIVQVILLKLQLRRIMDLYNGGWTG